MTTLVVGASGATGRLLVQQLLAEGETVRAVVRQADRLPKEMHAHPKMEIIEASLLEFDDAELVDLVRGCDAVASCLGHNLTFKGMYGQPRKLVTDATRRLCRAIMASDPTRPIKFVLMNTTGNRNHDLNERVGLAERSVLAIIRALVPPHSDNEQAAEHLRVTIGQANPAIEWVVVRPDTLANEGSVTPYDLVASPSRSAIFDAGKTSRINVADVMARLVTDEKLWREWQGRMPVVYNAV